jgi:hypothetical protein
MFIRDYWVFGLSLSSSILKNTTFRKLEIGTISFGLGGGRHSVGSVRISEPTSLDNLRQCNHNYIYIYWVGA